MSSSSSLRISRIAVLALAAMSAAMLTPVTATAQNASSFSNGDSASSQRLNLGVGRSVIVNLPRDAAEIFVGNPRVANAVVRSPRTLYVIATAGGQTTIFAMDKSGAQIARVEVHFPLLGPP